MRCRASWSCWMRGPRRCCRASAISCTSLRRWVQLWWYLLPLGHGLARTDLAADEHWPTHPATDACSVCPPLQLRGECLAFAEETEE